MILQLIKPDIVSQVAGKCNDPYFDDFLKDEYEEAIYLADKTLARRYDILNQCKYFNLKITVPPGAVEADYILQQKNTAIELPVNNLDRVHLVIINSKEYTRKLPGQIESDKYQYSLEYGTGSYLFNYSPRTEDDQIYFYYASTIVIEDYDDSTAPVIPGKFEEERIRIATRLMAEKGYAKFKEDGEKKYGKILSLNRDKGTNPEFMEQRGPIIMKPFKYP